MSKRSSGKVAMAVIVTVLVMAVAVGGVWYYMDTQLKAQQTRVANLQSQITGQATANAAYLELTEAGDFDFIDEIDANGGVAADDTANDATPAPTLTIENKDTQDDATSIYLTMWDPESSTGGVPTALEDTTLSFYVTWNGILYPLYLCEGGVGDYTDGVNIGDLPVGAATGTITFSAIADAAADDTYDDSGATYTVKVFVYQANAQDSTPVSFTLST